MARENTGPDFIEALARGLDVIRSFGDHHRPMSLSEIASGAALARPTARRILLTLEQLGYVRSGDAGFTLTPRVLELGVAYTLSAGMWDIALPYLHDLVRATNQAASVAVLDGSDIIYVARAAVPKVVSANITVGMRLPARSTALGKVLLSALDADRLAEVLAIPSASVTRPFREQPLENLHAELREIRARGWAATNEEMTPGVRSIAAPVRDGDAVVVAAVNLSAISAEVTHEQMTKDFPPLVLLAAGEIGDNHALVRAVPQAVVRGGAGPGGRGSGRS
ncbi:IclR family transcriptional regulator C-terminal domain-containing protein [Spongiactinospora sp. TRM90649]|uniref:IclR family transcriptional regulator domain-containing protein n=1 Tax=Spongiactinospora sp. TRM90649 TaxID=3031114 RepID=UPI0023F8378F|nr:IclR family transcriptional regulator C-terminal domain-containing protein [Spongiactinospora sp. TRM90649]MDF5753090.1 IclR family transcriptional regulator C-terminal domain-containing protein [Spongiactinospora sp. TRM90649]